MLINWLKLLDMIKNVKGVISVWLGTTKKNIRDFNKYTENMENPNSGSMILKDFGVGFIDSDMFGAFGTRGNKVIPVEELCVEVGANSNKTVKLIIEACKKRGIDSGNAIYYYGDHEFIPDTDGVNRLYNDLFYIGVFPDPRKVTR